ncbi:MAG: hypothetical protein JW751_31190 [Polyangiaceae bacterium]|nr:hypothetical protein [Polyangiaceae bacterium]
MIRGLTVGPIENTLFPGRGYGTEPFARGIEEARRLGARWVSITPYGRVFDLAPAGVSLTFEAPPAENRAAIVRSVAMAHAAGLRVLMVPHLWVETGAWRGELDPGDDAAWARWAHGYRAFVLTWAQVARDAEVDLLAVGIELRTWVTTTHAPSFVEIIRDVRRVYPGPLTYAANWDDVADTVILGELDVIGINAFFPLHWENGATFTELVAGGERAAAQAAEVATMWDKPVLFTEFGYTTRRDCAVRPWEWPEHLDTVVVDESAQAEAYFALLRPLLDAPWFAGFFVWRVAADPDDVTQEAEWGFSPRGKQAELILRDAYGAHYAGDGPRPVGASLYRVANTRIGVF